MHRTILVAAGENRPLHDAFALGVALARPRGAEVVLVHADIGGSRAIPDELVGLARDAPVDVPARAISVGAATITAALHRAVTEEHAEMLVVGTSHLGRVLRAVRGDIALGVVRDAPCAIAAAPLGYAAAVPKEPRVVGVAWDGSTEAGEALEWAVQLAERTGGGVEIVQVLGGADDEAAARVRLERLRRAAEERVPATIDLRHGHVADALAGAGGLDLLVMGSRRRGPIERVVLGSVSADVLHRAHCPVVVLPRGVYAPVETLA
ncbi:MAG TPA: universal stress protein [Baekduia sp.]|nr:universal stress protein [Baekduia sp.]